MSFVYRIKERLQSIYARTSFIVKIIVRFAFAFLAFWMINKNIGYNEALSDSVITLGLAAICAFLPEIVTVLIATLMVLIHFYTLSMPIALITGLIFLIMYIFYFKFSAKYSWLVILTAICIAYKMPLVLTVAIGLLASPVCLVPTAYGVFTYYMISFVKTSSVTFKTDDKMALIQSLMTFTKQLLSGKEVWVMIAAICVGMLVVYGIRKLSFSHSWKVASVLGPVVAGCVATLGNIRMDLHIPTDMLLISGIVAVVLGLIMEIIFLSVDYSRTEILEFEDDEYHYYVKAVPKFAVPTPEKSVTHISELDDEYDDEYDDDEYDDDEFEDDEEVVPARSTGSLSMRDTDEILLARSLQKELGLDNDYK